MYRVGYTSSTFQPRAISNAAELFVSETHWVLTKFVIKRETVNVKMDRFTLTRGLRGLIPGPVRQLIILGMEMRKRQGQVQRQREGQRWSVSGEGQEGMEPGSQYPLQRHDPSTLTSFHYAPLPEGSTSFSKTTRVRIKPPNMDTSGPNT